MFKIIKMISVALIIIFIVIVPFVVGQSSPNITADTVPKVLPVIQLQRALADSMEKLREKQRENDSLGAMRNARSPKVMRHLASLIKRKRVKPSPPDTVYIPVAIAVVERPDTVFAVKTDTVFIPRKKSGIFSFLKNKTKN